METKEYKVAGVIKPTIEKHSKTGMLDTMIHQTDVFKKFKDALDQSAPTFIASIIDLYNTDSKLQQCKPAQVIAETLKAAALKLPINKSLGYAYILPYNNSKKDAKGNWIKVMEPTFQMGYKGYIQLAMRTGQYQTINADVVYEGELQKVNKLTGEINFEGEKKSDKVVGYFCYFQLLNGFSKTLYMSVEQMANHAKLYGKGINKSTQIATLEALANTPLNSAKTTGWMGNFQGMAIKTVIRNLLSKYGYLSIEMQTAFANESTPDSKEELIEDHANSKKMDFSDTSYEDVTGEEDKKEPEKPKEADPGY